MKPFLFLGTRAEDEAADSEYAAVLRCAGLEERDVRRVRVERDELGPVDLDGLSGIVLGGGPFNSSDPEDVKSPVQRRAEADLRRLAEQVLDADFPFLGACYGVGVLGGLRGGLVDRTYGEPISSRRISLTEAGLLDPLLSAMPPDFDAFLGHKEAVSRLPVGAELLASSSTCPVQAFRMGRNVYATQFHPELDGDGLALRIETYRHHGYFEPDELDGLLAMARGSTVEHPPRLLSRFVELYGR
ncbi:glutamine amidotransferase [Nocardioides sp.]|uniref:glutamine amidotransferase n=1 Tax=Nocardioides sp. TaxID=35761 RepID=UPI00262B91D6|nr:glutamine amidotransferase [Nocardioides sp.]MDI6910734.1 glutamine amidotransferase [Nocardioides sp.]